MSRSVERVARVLSEAGIETAIVEMPESTRTAAEAAAAVGCEIDQIAKSIIFRGETSGRTILFITAGGNQVDPVRASALAGEHLGRADAGFVREMTGFAIGGVAPIAHKVAPRAFLDPRLLEFPVIYAAAGTPRHIFAISGPDLLRLSGAEEARFTS